MARALGPDHAGRIRGAFPGPRRLLEPRGLRGTPPYQIIEGRVTHNDEGEQISEWEISLQDIRAYLNASDSA